MGRPFQWSVTGYTPVSTSSRTHARTMATTPPTTTSIFTTTTTTTTAAAATATATTTSPAVLTMLAAIKSPATINSPSPLGSVFHFTAGPLPAAKLVFSPSPPLNPSGALKRCRPLNDVDGEHSAQFHKKKRRLRLFLITSRLSPVFSQPATYIVDRGSSKIAVWAKQRALGRNLLRKAAILNCIRTREREQQQDILQKRQIEMARQTFLYGSHDTLTHPVVYAPRAPFPREKHPPPNTVSKPILEDISTDTTITSPNFAAAAAAAAAATAVSPNFPPTPALLVVRGPDIHRPFSSPPIKANDGASTVASRKMVPPSSQVPRRDYIPLPPSPLGLSNYDALDLEDDFLADENDGNDADDDASSFSSTFSNTFSSHDGWNDHNGRRSGPGLMSPSDSPPTIYSDFSVLDPMEAVVDDHDLIEAFAGTSTTAGVGALEEARHEAERKREAERKKAEERMIEILEEKERQREVLFADLSTFVV